MPLDSSIALQYKPFQVEPQANALARILQLQGAQQQNALVSGQLQDQQTTRDEMGRIRNALAGLAPNADLAAQSQALRGTGTLTGLSKAAEIDKQAQALAESKAKTGHLTAQTEGEQFKTMHAKATAMADLISTATDQASYDAAKARGQAMGLTIDPNAPAQFDPRYVASQLAQAQTAKDRIEQQAKQRGLDLTERGQNMTAATARAGQAVQMRGQDIGASSTAATNLTHLQIAGLNPDGSPKQMPLAADGSVDLTKIAPEDMAAAQRYRTDGTLPPNMGRGAQGAAESRRIRAVATALDAQAGESSEDARVRQLALKGDVGAIAAMRKREVAIGANVKNFDFNADQVLKLSGQVDRTGVPIINAWINSGRRAVAGNPELAAFDTAVKTTVNEFAQIVGGTTSGASTEGEKKKAESLLNAQQTPEQIIAVINQMRVESKNRMQSFAAQRKEMMPTNGTPKASGGQGDASAVAGGSASAKTVVRTGTLNGKKVVQYSDGTTDYAD